MIAVAAPALAAAVSVLVIHELGHVVGGLLAGFRFRSISIGPLRVDDRFRISLHRGALSWSGGWVGMVPARADNLRWRALALVGGGPLANLLSGCAVLMWPSAKGLASGVFIAASLLAPAFDLPPFRRRELALDGWRILALLRDSAWGRRWLALMRLGAELERGVMPEAWSPESLARAVALQDDSPDTVSAHAFAFSSAFHRRADDEAARALETCLRHSHLVAPALREALMSDAAVFQARRRKRPDLAEQWLAAMPEAAQVPWSRARIEAGVREARGDLEGALSKLAEVERGMQALPDARQRATALRFLERWRSELQAQLRTPAAT